MERACETVEKICKGNEGSCNFIIVSMFPSKFNKLLHVPYSYGVYRVSGEVPKIVGSNPTVLYTMCVGFLSVPLIISGLLGDINIDHGTSHTPLIKSAQSNI